jgi:allantoin racemase
MKLTVLNPNTTESMTRLIERNAAAVAGAGVRLVAVNPSSGPASIESHYEEALAAVALLDVIKADQEGPDPSDGYLIACFGDPGLDAAREVSPGPVVGIAEAAMRTAQYLGRFFSVVTTLARTTGRANELVDRYGARGACRSVRACDVPVLDLETDAEARKKVLRECERAITEDGAEVIVLGCAGMADFCAGLAAELGVPVVDGVTAGITVLEGLIRAGLTTSRINEYAAPPEKNVAS